MKTAKEVSVCGMMAALGVVLMWFDSVFPLGLYLCPMAASFTLVVARE